MDVMLGWMSFALALVGVVLNGNKNLWCWPIWLASNVLLVMYSFTVTPIAYPLVVESIVFFATNIYGWRKWYKEKKNESL